MSTDLLSICCSITILDENDNVPEISLPTSCVLITEYHELHESIASIVGKDADDPATPNGRLEFTISQGNKEGEEEIFCSFGRSSMILNDLE